MDRSLDDMPLLAVAGRVGALLNDAGDALRLAMLGQVYLIRQDCVILCGQKAPETHSSLLTDYLSSAGNDIIEFPWRSFVDLGGAPNANFRRHVEMPLAQHTAEFIERAEQLLPLFDAETTQSLIGSDMAIIVRALPRVHLRIEWSRENEEFPSEAWVLFSHNANAFLKVPSLYLLGELCKDRILSLLRIY